jgi:hypothetical protein
MDENLREQMLKFIQENKNLSDEEIMDIYKQNSENIPVKNRLKSISEAPGTPDYSKKVREIVDPYMIKEKASEDILKERGYNPFRMKGKTAFKNKATGKVLRSLIPGIGLAASGLAEAFDAEDAGEGSDMSMDDSQERDVELVRSISKDDDKLNRSKLEALRRILGK